MEEIFLAVLYALGEFFLEVVLEVAPQLIFDFFLRWLRSELSTSPALNSILNAIGYFLLGVAVGVASVFVAPHPFVHPSRFHGISLLLSPLASGGTMSLLGRLVRKRGRTAIDIESFKYGFAFAFGMALVRLYFTY